MSFPKGEATSEPANLARPTDERKTRALARRIRNTLVP